MAKNIATSISDNLTQFWIITDHTTSQVLKIIESSPENSKLWSKKYFLPGLVKSIETVTLTKIKMIQIQEKIIQKKVLATQSIIDINNIKVPSQVSLIDCLIFKQQKKIWVIHS